MSLNTVVRHKNNIFHVRPAVVLHFMFNLDCEFSPSESHHQHSHRHRIVASEESTGKKKTSWRQNSEKGLDRELGRMKRAAVNICMPRAGSALERRRDKKLVGPADRTLFVSDTPVVARAQSRVRVFEDPSRRSRRVASRKIPREPTSLFPATSSILGMVF